MELETGRTHQIRVHLAAIGHPICGDPVYGYGEELGLSRQFLHASRLRFAHPVTGDEVDVSSPLPADLALAWRPPVRRVESLQPIWHDPRRAPRGERRTPPPATPSRGFPPGRETGR